MAKKYRKNNDGDIIGLVFSVVLLLGILTYFKRQFIYQHILYIYGACFLIGLVISIFGVWWSGSKKKRINSIFSSISSSGFESSINKFIDQFGKEAGRSKSPFSYREYMFDWKRLEDFRETFLENNIIISTENFDDIKTILKFYIDKKEKNYLNESLSSKSSHNLGELSKRGDQFEMLIVRLYNAMGYESKRIGGVGDQGGDVIAKKDGESILIQAKYYEKNVGNKAVQEAFSAQKYYGCNKAVVVASSGFTSEATELAHSTSVALMDKKLLQHKLSEFLHESWY